MIMIGNEPLQVLVINDSELQKIALVTVGQKNALVQKMREISEVLHVAGDKVVVDMSLSISGYPAINHTHTHLQVIPVEEYLEGEDACSESGFNATGAHLER